MDNTEIKQLMDVGGLNQKRLAERLGVTQAQVSHLLNGRRTAKGPILKLLEQMRSRYKRKLEAAE